MMMMMMVMTIIIIILIIILLVKFQVGYVYLDVKGNTRFLPVCIHYIVNNYGLPLLFIIP
jgi:hypothetical protein